MNFPEDRKLSLKKKIEEKAFIRANDTRIVSRGHGSVKKEGWLFDIRNILLEADALDDIAALFWDQFKDSGEVQVGGIEAAGIPLVAGLVAQGEKYGNQKNASGFFIRKSRKKDGLTKIIEGSVYPEKKIVLVDDLINSGKSLIRQIEVLEDAGHTVDAIWVLIRFRNETNYDYFKDRGITIHALFTLDDFKDTLGTQILADSDTTDAQDAVYAKSWKVRWRFSSQNPSYQHVVPKSDPAIDDERVYMGSDIGIFWAINQSDGSVAWHYKVPSHAKGKGIFSSPVIYYGTVYFGAYDGNVYALDAKTGKRKWMFSEADWVGSSPSISEKHGLIFIGLEFGLWRRRGGLAALDLHTGKRRWLYEMPCYTHATPLYIPEHDQVVVGSNDGAAYLFNAKSGELVWKFSTHELTEEELSTGFGATDIKDSFAYDARHDQLFVGRRDGSFLSLDRKTGKLLNTFNAEFGIYSTPVIYRDTVIFTSLDKHMYCLDLLSFKEKWRWNAGARIFCSPVLIEDTLFIGANTGRLTTLDPENGRPLRFFTVSERITNKIVKNPKTGLYFLPTFANQIYCIEETLGQ